MRLALPHARRPGFGFDRLMREYGRNYERLGYLVPDLRTLRGGTVSLAVGMPDLHIEIIEQNRYTTTLVLTYALQIDGRQRREPEVQLRAYHDARQAEVLAVRDRRRNRWQPLRDGSLSRKWRYTRFLGKWLAYCLLQGHGLPQSRRAVFGVTLPEPAR